MTRQATLAVIGAGPAGLMAAEIAAAAGVAVTIYERMPSPGRKFLLAGRGGLNLTHSEGADSFRARYGDRAAALAPALVAFGPDALRRWCADLGIETFVGSSGRVFPLGLKTSPLLRAWLRRLDAAGVRLETRHRWRGWDDAGRLRFATPTGDVAVAATATVLGLGGASWPQLGTDGAWTEAFDPADVAPLRASNCGIVVRWSEDFRDRFEGQPLKAVAVEACGMRARGDLVVTRDGIEGGPIYALSASLREAITSNGAVAVCIDLRPDLDAEALAGRLGRRRQKDSFGNGLRKTLGLAPVAVALLREADRTLTTPARALGVGDLAALVRAIPLTAEATMPITRAISTAGGVRFDALDGSLMLRGRPGTFLAGEMLDWEAPTGGYLLTAAFATGRAAGTAAAAWANAMHGHRTTSDAGQGDV